MQGFESTPFNSLQSKTSNSDEPGLYSLLKPLFQERLLSHRPPPRQKSQETNPE
jgi:hypothetical protein